jgi:hypothetical protein
MTGKTHIFSSLSHDLVSDGSGNPVRAEPPQGQIIAVFDEFLDRFLDGRELAFQLTVFLPEKRSGLIRIRICENFANSLI